MTDVLHETSLNIGSETTRTTLLSLGPLRLLSLWRGALCAVCSLYYLYPVSNLSCFSICYPCVSYVFHLCMFHFFPIIRLISICSQIACALPSHVSIPQVFSGIYSCWDSLVQPQFPRKGDEGGTPNDQARIRYDIFFHLYLGIQRVARYTNHAFKGFIIIRFIIIITSSTAQGGGGRFKESKL